MPYPPKTAAKLANISVSSVKVYAGRFARYMSPGANPGHGITRNYSAADVRLLRFVGDLSRQAITQDEIAARLEAGALDDFDWMPPEDAATEPQEAATGTQSALAVVQFMQGELQAARAREDALRLEVADLRERVGRAEGELAAVKRPWYRRLFG